MTTDDAAIESIHRFWFGDDPKGPSKDVIGRWFKKDPAFDESIRSEFAALMERALDDELDAWQTSARGALALIVLLDQFPRNAYRGTPRSFAYDEKARSVARRALTSKFDLEVSPAVSVFFYLPFEHSEDADDQRLCVERLSARAEGTSGDTRMLLDNYIGYAEKHQAIVARFGRFPHRNVILGRTSTAEEIAFLQEEGSSF
jgi:uncharacterized protein (DUF924 family)